MNESFNDLEKAYLNAHLGMAETVAYFKELRESILLFLTPYHSEVEGVFEVGNGSSMTFIFWGVNGQQAIPVFTSYARLEEALRAAGNGRRRMAWARCFMQSRTFSNVFIFMNLHSLQRQ